MALTVDREDGTLLRASLIATSGIFYPITNFPVWLQWIAPVFPSIEVPVEVLFSIEPFPRLNTSTSDVQRTA